MDTIYAYLSNPYVLQGGSGFFDFNFQHGYIYQCSQDDDNDEK